MWLQNLRVLIGEFDTWFAKNYCVLNVEQYAYLRRTVKRLGHKPHEHIHVPQGVLQVPHQGASPDQIPKNLLEHWSQHLFLKIYLEKVFKEDYKWSNKYMTFYL